jgi:hypothetical protein
MIMSEGQQPKEPRNSRQMGLEEMINAGSRKLAELIGLNLLAVVGITRQEEGNWSMKLEFIEREGIPNTMDMIGLYEATFDQYGHLLNYERQDMRKRGEPYT